MVRGLTPNPERLDYISPTTANALLVCPLRVAFQRDGAVHHLTMRPRPDAVLGSASHALAEAAARGTFDQVPRSQLDAQLSSYWDEHVESAHEHFQGMDVLGPVPPPSRWAFYAIKRARAIRYARSIVDGREAGRHAVRPQVGRVDVELDLRADDPPLTGRIDRVELVSNGARLVDLKTSAPPNGVDTLEPPHKNQLLLYAALYRAATGVSPRELAIQYLDGTRTTIAVDWHEVEALITQVLQLRNAFNSAVETAEHSTWYDLARPDPQSCLHCDFEPVCGPFLSELARRQPSFAACAVGLVEEVQGEGDTVAIRLRLETAGDEDQASDPTSLHVLAVPTRHVPTPGDYVSVCWATRTANDTDLRVSWQSSLYVWPSG